MCLNQTFVHVFGARNCTPKSLFYEFYEGKTFLKMRVGTSCVMQQNLSAMPKFTPTNEANRKIITSLFISMALLLRAGTSVPGSCIDVASVYSFKASS